jgi:hypothetical protein
MKQTPEEKILNNNFLPGSLTRDGFLARDSRHIHDIIAADSRNMESLGIDKDRLIEKMRAFVDAGKAGLEQDVQIKPYFTIRVRWARGMLPCPFGETGLHHKLVCTVVNHHSGETVRFSQLSLHMIEAHGFFGGLGSVYRLEPAILARVLEI